jgi:hypothetical protein
VTKREKERAYLPLICWGRKRDERLLLCHVEEGRVGVRGWTRIIVNLSLFLNLIKKVKGELRFSKKTEVHLIVVKIIVFIALLSKC